MPNVKFGVNAKKAVDAEGGVKYTGKRPPHKTIYRVIVKRLGMKINKNEDFMLNAVLEILEPEGSPKAQYNGYGFWWNGNVTEEGAGYINQMLDSISGGKRAVKQAFWEGKCRVAEAPKKGGKAAPVEAIGPMKINPGGMEAIVYAELGQVFKNNQELAVGRWLMSSEVPDDADENLGEESDDKPSEDDVDVDIDDDDDDAVADDVDLDDDGDDDDEPPF